MQEADPQEGKVPERTPVAEQVNWLVAEPLWHPMVQDEPAAMLEEQAVLVNAVAEMWAVEQGVAAHVRDPVQPEAPHE